jgi:hypothetical protein
MRTVVRRRHRTWMFSMCMASLGWGAWWLTLVLLRFAPAGAPDVRVTEWFVGACAVVGFLAAVWSFRAKLAWILIMSIALFANASLLAMPWIFDLVRFDRSAQVDARAPAGDLDANPR